MVIDGIDLGIVRTVKIALQLQVIGRICKDQIDRPRRKRIHDINAIARYDLVQRKRARLCRLGFHRHILPRPRGILVCRP